LRYLESEYCDQKAAVSVKEIEDDFEYFASRSEHSIIQTIVAQVIDKIVAYGSPVDTIETMLRSIGADK
jgi:hypothetical protein